MVRQGSVGLTGGGGALTEEGVTPARLPRRRRDPSKRTLTASEAAAIIGVSVATVRGWADQGVLPSHRTVGGHRRFEMEELREWLSARGAPVRRRGVVADALHNLPTCPRLARALNSRTDEVVDRVMAGFQDEVATPFPPPSPAAVARAASRFVRLVSAGLEAGNPGVAAGRAELAGYRGGVEGAAGVRVVIEHARFGTAVIEAAERAIDAGDADGDYSLASTHAVIDHLLAALIHGYRDALDSI